MTLWRAPSGRYHWLRSCSGGAGRLRMVRARLTRAEFDAADKCRCVSTWRPEVTHFARPRPIDGKTPTRGEQVCSTCGRPIVRSGPLMGSDGVRGEWRHMHPRES